MHSNYYSFKLLDENNIFWVALIYRDKSQKLSHFIHFMDDFSLLIPEFFNFIKIMKKSISYFGVLVWITIFSIAMAYLESAVVVYLRALTYPEGFTFPMQPIGRNIALTEIFREAATIIMLIGAGILAGKNFTERFAWFLYSFAIWDIFYYVFLKILINWPSSLLTWDILFLIPVTWVGPVISPVIVSLTMILLAGFIIYFNSKNLKVRINWQIWTLLINGSLVLILSFIWDYSSFILSHYSLSQIWSMPDNHALYDLAQQYVPQSFNWGLFGVGELIILIAITWFAWHYFAILKKSFPK